MPTPKLTISVPEAASQLGISRAAAYEAAKTGQIPTIRIGARVLVPNDLFARLLDGSWKPPTSEVGSG